MSSVDRFRWVNLKCVTDVMIFFSFSVFRKGQILRRLIAKFEVWGDCDKSNDKTLVK